MFTDLLEVIAKDAVGNLGNDVIASQRNKGLRASGRSAASLEVRSQAGDHRVATQLWGDISFTWQANGRRPNKSGKPSRRMVEELTVWLKYKGLDYSPWAVATNIAKKGIDVPNPHNPGGVLSEPLDAKRIKELVGPRIQGAVFKELKSMLFNV